MEEVKLNYTIKAHIKDDSGLPNCNKDEVNGILTFSQGEHNV